MRRRRKNFDWAAMQTEIDAGAGYLRCHAKFGIAHATWIKAIRLGDLKVDLNSPRHVNARKRLDWLEIQAFYDTGATVRQCMATFGFCGATWEKARKRGRIVTRRRVPTTAEALARSRSRITIKRHLLRAGILENRCDWCGITSWRGRPIAIQIDHINGVRDDHRIENLRMLCPNCHSQTETFAAKNIKIKRWSRFV